ncbi:MAG: leucine-rich repeat domain-containing protein, partial [Ureaplasma sp.]|nr:leucine-rich repeat domain-containing protein [Ureaplasma sp.]
TISFQENAIDNLRQEIINLINTNGVSKTFIDSYLPYEIKDLVDNVDTSNNQKLSNFVSIPTYSDNSIEIQLKNDVGKYKFISYQTISNDILITSNEIRLNNIQLPTSVTPQESPEDWFTWNASQITGLTTIGLSQKRIVLPSKVTSITNNVFNNNKTLISVDMTLASITSIGYGTFSNCGSLVSITIPDSVTSIGISAFYNCTSLTSIMIPNSVIRIAANAFYDCSHLTSITMSNSVTSIGTNAFNNVPSTCIMNVSNTWDQTLATNIGYQGKFNIISSLTKY